MKNLIKTLVCIVLSFVTIFCTDFRVYALDFDPCQIDLYIDNAPENTAYIDILVPISKNSDDYIDFNNPPLFYTENSEKKPLLIDQNSQIVQYNDNGYSSLSLHTEYIRTAEVHDRKIYLTDIIGSIYKKYKNFTAVYVDENGNILNRNKSIYSHHMYSNILWNHFIIPDIIDIYYPKIQKEKIHKGLTMR